MDVKVIEKHVTLNKNMAGPDHLASLNYDEFKNMIIFCDDIYKAMAQIIKILNSEKMLHSILSRRIVAKKINIGEVKLNFNNLKTVLTYSGKGMLPNNI